MLAVLLASTLAVFAGDFDDRTELTVKVARGEQLEVHNFNGDVAIEVWSRNSIRIQAEHGRGITIGVDRKGKVQRIEAIWQIETDEYHEDDANRSRSHSRSRYRAHGLPHVDYQITVPTWIPIGVYGVNTDVMVEGVRDRVRIETVNGDVWLDGGKSVDLSSINGEIYVRGARGRVHANSINDDVSIEDVIGSVFGEAVNGDIILRAIKADTIETTTVRGDVFFEGKLERRGRYLFSTHTGDVMLLVPKTINATVAFFTYNGELQTSFPVNIPKFEGYARKGKTFTFQLGDGEAHLELKTFSGDIELDWLDEDDSE
jgi:DUF4097 and DUF4098 domain-containing protein YvlB